MNIRSVYFGFCLALAGIFIFNAVNAQPQHPYCTKALRDVRTAKGFLLQITGGKAMSHNEKEALRLINMIVRDIQDAAIDNGKESGDNLKTAKRLDDAARIKQCIEYLKKAKDELSREKDSQFAGGLRDRSIKNCDEAIKFVERANH